MHAVLAMGARTRLVVLVCAAAGLGFAVAGWFARRPPEWNAWAGESSIAVQAAGAAPSPDSVRLRSGGAALDFRGAVAGDRLRFTGLTPDTPYVVEWRAGPFTTASREIRTLPMLLSSLDLELTPGAGDVAVRLRPHDPRLAGVELQLVAAGSTLPRTAGHFVASVPDGASATELAIALPESGEVHALDWAIPGPEALLDELARAQSELEMLLAPDKQPSLVDPAALERWEPAPQPARKLAASGGAGLLARLRRLAPFVRAVTAGRYPAGTRWRVVRAASQLVCAEVLAVRLGQPALGVLDWAPELVRYARPAPSVARRRTNLLARPVHLTHPSYESSAEAGLVTVVGGTAESTSAPELNVSLPPPAGAWVGVGVAMQVVFNSGPPELRFPRAHISLELPLLQAKRGSAEMPLMGAFPDSLVDVWVRREPADADWTALALAATVHPRSKRLSPSYVFQLATLAGVPPKR